MGDFRIIIDAVGGHGQDRSKKDGETVLFYADGDNNPEVCARTFIKALVGSGCSVNKATIIHWPADNYPEQREAGKEVVDDLLTGTRKGSF